MSDGYVDVANAHGNGTQALNVDAPAKKADGSSTEFDRASMVRAYALLS
jgi:hypothetical protein